MVVDTPLNTLKQTRQGSCWLAFEFPVDQLCDCRNQSRIDDYLRPRTEKAEISHLEITFGPSDLTFRTSQRNIERTASAARGASLRLAKLVGTSCIYTVMYCL